MIIGCLKYLTKFEFNIKLKKLSIISSFFDPDAIRIVKLKKKCLKFSSDCYNKCCRACVV